MFGIHKISLSNGRSVCMEQGYIGVDCQRDFFISMELNTNVDENIWGRAWYFHAWPLNWPPSNKKLCPALYLEAFKIKKKKKRALILQPF